MKLLIETADIHDLSVITEAKDENGDKSYYIEGIYMQAEVLNGNNRIYPKRVLSEAVDKLQIEITKNKLLGELNHPDTNSSQINPDRACIKIQKLYQEGNNVMGRAKVMKSLPCGQIVHGLLSEGVTLGVSSRGFGSVKRDKSGVAIVESPLVLKTVDVVTEPSAPDAYMTAIMENREWVYENGVLIEKEKEVKALINENARKNVDVAKTFSKILNMIVNNNLRGN